MINTIYFDNAATTRPCEEAVIAAANNMRNNFGNPSSLHKVGIEAEKVITEAKKTFMNKLGVTDGDVFFTSGATESNNTALFGAAHAYKRSGNRIVTTAIEHPSVQRVMDKLEEEGFEIVRLSPKDHDDFEKALIDAVNENTIILSFMAVNNETGFHTDAKKVYSAVKRRFPKCIIHVDGVQGFCKVPLAGDLISVSSHKIHGVKGLGALYCAKGIRFIPIMFGGGQQKNLRSGTEPVDLIAAFDAAVKAYPSSLSDIQKLAEYLLQRLGELEGVTVNSRNSIPSIVNFSVDGIRSEIMLHYLEEREIYVSSGSACSKGKVSPVLSALGVSPKNADSAIRVSFCRYNTKEEIDALIDGLRDGIVRFRR